MYIAGRILYSYRFIPQSGAGDFICSSVLALLLLVSSALKLSANVKAVAAFTKQELAFLFGKFSGGYTQNILHRIKSSHVLENK